MLRMRSPALVSPTGCLLSAGLLVILAGSASAQNATTAAYEYDGLGRLKSVNYTLSPVAGAASITMQLDALGNRATIGAQSGMASTGVNKPPELRPDAFSAAPMVPTVLDVLANDTDPNGDRLTIIGFIPLPPGSDMQIVGNKLVYTPAAGTNNTRQTFKYSVREGVGDTYYQDLTVDINELPVSFFGTNSNYQNVFSGLAPVSGMRDSQFGNLSTPPPYSTTHGTDKTIMPIPNGDPGSRFVYSDFGGKYFVNKLVLAPISTNLPSPFNLGQYWLNGAAITYNDITGCPTTGWKYADNVSAATDNNFIVLNMADVVAQCIGVAMPPATQSDYDYLGLSEFRMVGQPVGASGFRAPSGVVDRKNISPPFRRAIFERELQKRRKNDPKFASLVSASFGASNVPENPLATAPIGFGLNTLPPTPSAPSSGNDPYAVSGSRMTELIPKAFTSSSTLSDTLGGLSGEGMRDGDFATLPSTFQTSISSKEWVSADLGDVRSISRIDLAPSEALGARGLDGASVYTSKDCQSWTWAGRVTGATASGYVSVPAGQVEARCIKIEVEGAYLGLGDFRVF